MVDAFSSRGIAASRARSVARRAGLISRVAISESNKSSASSTAAASNRRAVASSVAVLRGSARPLSSGALLAHPYLASAATRLTGTACTCALPAPSASTSFTRINAFDKAVPESLRGGVRNRSSSETLLPGGTSSRSTSRIGSSTSTPAAASLARLSS
ncbi:hypothetical protein [Micromonospora fulviviridis]|uniref:Uncharacterized protein n=1 Tax=Micromonospora fulviviridis TaxID=47860 RepID=A0ABV2VVX1_9ACTN